MARHAKIAPWFSVEQLRAWMQEAPDTDSLRRRLAIWLTVLGPYPARQIAGMLGVSTQAVWKWVGEYNRLGPDGLDRQGRGGRRWALLTIEEEMALLARWEARAQAGDVVTAKQLHAEVAAAVGRDVSLAYVYRLLHRHHWRKVAPRPRHTRQDPAARAAFKQTSRTPSR
jgi:transposase